jgi:thiamine biosynthesis protein ThiC
MREMNEWDMEIHLPVVVSDSKMEILKQRRARNEASHRRRAFDDDNVFQLKLNQRRERKVADRYLQSAQDEVREAGCACQELARVVETRALVVIVIGVVHDVSE